MHHRRITHNGARRGPVSSQVQIPAGSYAVPELLSFLLSEGEVCCLGANAAAQLVRDASLLGVQAKLTEHPGGISFHVSHDAVLVDTQAAAVAARVAPSTIRSWINRGKLQRVGFDAAGRALVDLASVYEMTKQRPPHTSDREATE